MRRRAMISRTFAQRVPCHSVAMSSLPFLMAPKTTEEAKPAVSSPIQKIAKPEPGSRAWPSPRS